MPVKTTDTSCFLVVPGAAGCWPAARKGCDLRVADAVADEASKEDDDALLWLLLLWLLQLWRRCSAVAAAAATAGVREIQSVLIAWMTGGLG